MAKKPQKNAQKIGFGTVLGLIWGGFGTVLGLFWALLGHFCSYFGRSKSYLVKALVQDGLQEAFSIDFGRVWGGFVEDLDGSWEDLGSQN